MEDTGTPIILRSRSSPRRQSSRRPIRTHCTLVTWPGWSVTARIDTWKYWRTVVRAIACHQTQVPAYHVLEQLSQEQRAMLWGTQSYYRVFSLVNGGRQVEEDLFAGLR